MKTLTLGKKIILGFGSLLLITLMLGGMAVWVMSSSSGSAKILANEYASELGILSEIGEHLTAGQLSFRTYSFTGDKADADSARTHLNAAQQQVVKATELAARSPHLPKLKQEVGPYAQSLAAYIKMLDRTVETQEAMRATRKVMDENAASFIANITAIVDQQSKMLQEDIDNKAAPSALQERRIKMDLGTKIRNEGNQVRIAGMKTLADRDPEVIQKALAHFANMTKLFAEITPLIRQPANIEELKKAKESADKYEDAVTKMASLLQTNTKLLEERRVLNKDLSDRADAIYASAIKHTVEAATGSATALSAANAIMIVGLLVAIGIGVTLALLITRSITRSICNLIDSLNEGSNQTTAAAGQVSEASQTLAEDASKQAASLQETSSSLVEMASMTKRTAENAQSAKELARDAHDSAQKATEDINSMALAVKTVQESSSHLSAAMDKIDLASKEITQVMKTIDEIAFQTNILSLNAAVEAARAGEAGSGFAVVADEVRSLAQRSAEAARQTARMIKDSSDSSHQGTVVTQKVAADLDNMSKTASKVTESLDRILGKVKQVDSVIAEISTACVEQERGTEQLNAAVSQMDKATQGNASTAEETASAAEELNAQTLELKNSVRELQVMVGAAEETSRSSASHAPSPASPKPHRFQSTARKETNWGDAIKRSEKPAAAKAEVIPMESDFKDQ